MGGLGVGFEECCREGGETDTETEQGRERVGGGDQAEARKSKK